MSYSFRFESKIFFWIIGLFITTIIFCLLFYLKVFSEKFDYLSFVISLALLFIFFFIGFFTNYLPTKTYSLINKKKNLLKELEAMNIEDSDKKIEKMIKRFKEVFYNINFSEKEKSIDILQRTIGFSKENAKQVYLTLKDISKTKYILIFAGILISIIVYLLITNLNIFLFLTETRFLPISISLFIFLFLFFKAVVISKLPVSFYLNLLVINKKQLIENKELISKTEDDFKQLLSDKEKVQENTKQMVFDLTSKGVSKKDILDILDSKQNLTFQLKEIIMQSPESRKTTSKTDYDEINKYLKNILDKFNEIKDIDNTLINIKDKISEIKKVQETIEKINSDDWDYYKNLNFSFILSSSKEFEKKITNEIFEKIEAKRTKQENYNQLLKDLYDSFLPYKDSFSKEKISSILISRGYSYETVIDLLDLFKKNKIDLDKNKRNFQTRLITRINNIYDSFKD